MSDLNELVEAQRLSERQQAWATYEKIHRNAERGQAVSDKEIASLRRAQETLGPRLAEIDPDGSLVAELGRCQTLADGFDAAQIEAQKTTRAMADREAEFAQWQKAFDAEREEAIASLEQARDQAQGRERAARQGKNQLAGHDRRRRAIVHDISVDAILARDREARLQEAGRSVHGPGPQHGQVVAPVAE